MKKFLVVLTVLSVVLCTAPAFALQTTFFGEDDGGMVTTNSDAAKADFFSHLSGVGTEDFESFAVGAGAPLVTNFGSAGTATLTGTGEIVSGLSTGRFPISGTKYWEVSGEFGLTFAAPIAAFGFYGTDIGDFNGQVTVTTVGGVSTTYTIPNSTGAENFAYTALYWGIIDTDNLFTSVVFGNTAAGTDYFGFDDFSIGSIEQVVPTPEPATMLLLGFGLVGLMGLRRR